MIVLCMCVLFLVCLFLAKITVRLTRLIHKEWPFQTKIRLKALMSYSNGHAELHRSHICNNFLVSLVKKEWSDCCVLVSS